MQEPSLGAGLRAAKSEDEILGVLAARNPERSLDTDDQEALGQVWDRFESPRVRLALLDAIDLDSQPGLKILAFDLLQAQVDPALFGALVTRALRELPPGRARQLVLEHAFEESSSAQRELAHSILRGTPDLTDEVGSQLVAMAASSADEAFIDWAKRWATRPRRADPPVEEKVASTTPDPESPRAISARADFSADAVGARDSLDVVARARIFAHLLAAEATELPTAIGLFGAWGAGKSSFMHFLRQEIDDLVARGGEPSPYVGRIAQIEFNAWHYVDADLWASLATRVFEGIEQEIAGAGESAPERVRRQLRGRMHSAGEARKEAEARRLEAIADRQRAEAELGRLEGERRQLDAELLKSFAASLGEDDRSLLARVGGQIGVADPLASAAALLDGRRQLESQLRSSLGLARAILRRLGRRELLIGLGGLLLLAGGVVLAHRYDLGAGLQIVVGLATSAAALIALIRRAAEPFADLAALRDLVRKLQDFRRGDAGQAGAALRQRIADLDLEIDQKRRQAEAAEKEIEEVRAELARIDAGGLVYDFLARRLGAGGYRDRLGFIATIRRDFEELEKILDDWADAENARPHDGEGRKKGPAPLERIVLYVDDLDRCHPDRVVEVLQALHLLLSFRLFAVVVAVDPRWLARSLYRAYLPEVFAPGRALAEVTDKGLEELPAWARFRPEDYLEKVFQIPFRLPAMDAAACGRLIRDLGDGPVPEEAAKQAGDEAAAAPGAADSAAAVGPAIVSPPVALGAGVVAAARTAREYADEAMRARADRASSRLEKSELDFLVLLGPFLATPRQTKRFLNIYRLLRVRATQAPFSLDRFLGPRGEFRFVAFALALALGFPRDAPIAFRLLEGLHSIGSLHSLWTAPDRGLSARFVQVLESWDACRAWDEVLGRDRAGPENPIEGLRAWLPEVERYLFVAES